MFSRALGNVVARGRSHPRQHGGEAAARSAAITGVYTTPASPPHQGEGRAEPRIQVR